MVRPESVGQQSEIDPPRASPMGVEDDPIVMVFFRLPAPEIPAVDEIDVHAGESQLESPMNAQSG